MRDLKKVLVVGFFILGIFVLPAAYANEAAYSSDEHSGYAHRKHERMGKKGEEIYNQLNLTQDQKKQLEANKQKHRENMEAVFEKMKSYKEDFNHELMKSTLDMNKINEIHSQFKTVQSQMSDDRLNSILEVRKILTPEQFSKFLSLMDQHKHEHKRHWDEEK